MKISVAKENHLKQGTRELLHGASKVTALNSIVQADDANVLLSSVLLRLHKTRGALNADDQTPCHLYSREYYYKSLV